MNHHALIIPLELAQWRREILSAEEVYEIDVEEPLFWGFGFLVLCGLILRLIYQIGVFQGSTDLIMYGIG